MIWRADNNVGFCIEFLYFPTNIANTGDKPLVVQQAFGSCGCTVATPPKDPIAPGAKGVIKVSYNGKGKFKGFFKKAITVRSNASNSIVRVYVQGNMEVDDW